MATVGIDAHTAEEFRVATDQAAFYQSSSGRLKLVGEDARDLLNRLSTNLIDPDASPGSVKVTVLTSDRGRIVDLVCVIHCGDYQLMLTSPGQQQAIIEFLDKYTIMEDLEIEDVTGKTVMLNVAGPSAAEIMQKTVPEAVADFVPGTFRPVTVGPEAASALLILPPSNPETDRQRPEYLLLFMDIDAAQSMETTLRDAGAVGISAATAETLRIARQRPLYGAEMSDTYNPLEAGLIGAIDFHKGCYIGQEVIARLDTYEKVQKYLVALHFQADNDGVDNLAGTLPGSRLVDADGKAMGLVTSATVVPTANGAGVIGLGYVRTAAAKVGNALSVTTPDGEAISGLTAHITAQPQLFGGEQPTLSA